MSYQFGTSHLELPVKMFSYLHMMGDTTKEPCHVPFCQHRDMAEGFDCTFIRFPLDRSKRNQWIQEISAYGHLEKEPTYLSKICSCHFENGDSAQPPSIFPWTEHPDIYKQPKTSRATKQVMAREAARQKASAVNFLKEKTKVDKDTIYCDSIILTFDTSQITGNKKSTCMSIGSISECELVNDISHPKNTSIAKYTQDKSTQTSILPSIECATLRAEVETLKKKLEKMSKRVFGVNAIRGKEEYFKLYCGIGESTFNSFVTEIVRTDSHYSPKNLSIEDEVLLTLMKIRLNTGFADLALRFNIPQTAICPILTRHIETLHTILFVPMRNYIAINEFGSKVELSALKTQKSIINCTNIVAESALADEDSVVQKNPKSGFKVLMGVTPNQVVTYCSDVFRATVSKEEIFQQSDLDRFLKPGDLILNDRDQSLLKIVLKDGSKASKYCAGDTEVYRQKEHLCFARTMRRLRNYQIIPSFPQTLFKLSTKIVQLCVALINYQNPNFWDGSTSGATNSQHHVEEQVEVVYFEEAAQMAASSDMDNEQLVEVETEIDDEF